MISIVPMLILSIKKALNCVSRQAQPGAEITLRRGKILPVFTGGLLLSVRPLWQKMLTVMCSP
jgi:hypothetical protein